MKTLLKFFDIDWTPTLRILLNMSGTIFVIAGIMLLPIDISYRLIILGIFTLVLWRTLSD